jgi:hypothetical protein
MLRKVGTGENAGLCKIEQQTLRNSTVFTDSDAGARQRAYTRRRIRRLRSRELGVDIERFEAPQRRDGKSHLRHGKRQIIIGRVEAVEQMVAA